ncbi:hypothetical protein A8709_00180 [Paenibacillus pectinilyticus]|uniref:Glycosyl transferase family 1 domain-containing protein n=1 Tax=Paenibacillus pectinilyticus TaxID=512399 RepID=A0A1C1A0N8_9BACL|nr:glycosyltransferase family 4 protein [Paenibacillus pectinilyticus]OCT13995.1 hypothetical protein A8709_00180 [Paenibacillus pectinilyticus]
MRSVIGGIRTAHLTKRHLVILTPGSFAIPSGRSSSVEHVVQHTAEALVNRMPITVIGRKAALQGWRSVRKGVTYQRVTFQGAHGYLLRASQQISRLKPAIIQVENRPHYVRLLRRKFPKAKLSLVIHSTAFINPPYISAKALRASLQAANVIIVNSEFLKGYVQQKVPGVAHKIVTHYLGVDVGRFISKWSGEGSESRAQIRRELGFEHRKIILYMGRLIPQKGVHHALHAMRNVIQSEPSALLLIVGSAFYGSKRITSYVKELGRVAKTMPGHVRFIPYVNHQEMPEWIRLADVVVVPSMGSEAFGLVNVEAMASGVPVVATRAGGIQEVIEDGRTGLLIHKEDMPTELAPTLLRVLQDEALQRRMGEQGLERVRDKFTWQQAAEVRWELYRTMLEASAIHLG